MRILSLGRLYPLVVSLLIILFKFYVNLYFLYSREQYLTFPVNTVNLPISLFNVVGSSFIYSVLLSANMFDIIVLLSCLSACSSILFPYIFCLNFSFETVVHLGFFDSYLSGLSWSVLFSTFLHTSTLIVSCRQRDTGFPPLNPLWDPVV